MWVNFIKKQSFIGCVMVVVLIANFFLPSLANAQVVNFSQSILPVRFVYLDNQNEIQKIWSNVSSDDSLYVVKFLNQKSQKEIKMNSNIFGDYQNMIRRSKLMSGELLASSLNSYNKGNSRSLSVDFIQDKNSIEEVHTYT